MPTTPLSFASTSPALWALGKGQGSSIALGMQTEERAEKPFQPSRDPLKVGYSLYQKREA